eukprot:scaffold32444_cov60-Phaeocystis_antarctica.AAC.1
MTRSWSSGGPPLPKAELPAAPSAARARWSASRLGGSVGVSSAFSALLSALKASAAVLATSSGGASPPSAALTALKKRRLRCLSVSPASAPARPVQIARQRPPTLSGGCVATCSVRRTLLGEAPRLIATARRCGSRPWWPWLVRQSQQLEEAAAEVAVGRARLQGESSQTWSEGGFCSGRECYLNYVPKELTLSPTHPISQGLFAPQAPLSVRLAARQAPPAGARPLLIACRCSPAAAAAPASIAPSPRRRGSWRACPAARRAPRRRRARRRGRPGSAWAAGSQRARRQSRRTARRVAPPG